MRYIEPGNILQDLDGKMSAGVTVSDQHLHSTPHGKHSLLFPSDGMPDRTLPSQKAFFFFPSLKHGIAFDSVAVQAT